MGSLALTYFRIRMHTIIGAAPFHCPVRDGKEWDQSAMGTRLNFLPACLYIEANRPIGKKYLGSDCSRLAPTRTFTLFKVIGSSRTGN